VQQDSLAQLPFFCAQVQQAAPQQPWPAEQQVPAAHPGASHWQTPDRQWALTSQALPSLQALPQLSRHLVQPEQVDTQLPPRQILLVPQETLSLQGLPQLSRQLLHAAQLETQVPDLHISLSPHETPSLQGAPQASWHTLQGPQPPSARV
jgi:hypothetical protein